MQRKLKSAFSILKCLHSSFTYSREHYYIFGYKNIINPDPNVPKEANLSGYIVFEVYTNEREQKTTVLNGGNRVKCPLMSFNMTHHPHCLTNFPSRHMTSH